VLTRPAQILLAGHMVADRASDQRSGDRVVVSKMSRDPTDDRPLQTTSCIGCAAGGGGGGNRQCEDQGVGFHDRSFQLGL